MPRQPKGILGVRKDPKNQMLFSFSVREGEEWPSDDEEDSDYDPGHNSDSDNASKSKQKRKKPVQKKKTTVSKKRKTVSASGRHGDTKQVEPFVGNIPPLPVELWDKIFRYVVQTEGSLPFLTYAAKVCKMWKELSCRPYLWKKCDVSYGWAKITESKLKWLCRERLSECEDLDMTGSAVMAKPGAVQAIASHVGKLKILNLTRCNKLPCDSLVKVVNGCPLLEDLNLTSSTADSVSSTTLNHLVDKCGPNLRRLVISNNTLRGFNVALNAIMEKCPNLEHLDISNCTNTSGFISLDIEKFQRSCPKMRTLGLANTAFRAPTVTQRVQEESVGFPDLEELSVAVTSDDTAFTFSEDVVIRLVKSAVRLRLLDLRGCRNMQAVASLVDIEATDLEQLYLSRSAAATFPDLSRIINKWRHSLTDLDLSWNNFRSSILELAMVSLCAGEPASVLQNISLAGTHVNMDIVTKILTNIPKLQSIDLSSCRNVDRGYKREYKTAGDMESLRKSLR